MLFTISYTYSFQCYFFRLISEKREIEKQTSQVKKVLEDKVKSLEEELEIAKRQVTAAMCGAEVKKDKIEEKIEELEDKIKKEKQNEQVSSTIFSKKKV